MGGRQSTQLFSEGNSLPNPLTPWAVAVSDPWAVAVYCANAPNNPRDISDSEYETIRTVVTNSYMPQNERVVVVSFASNCVLYDTSKSSDYNTANGYNTRRLNPANSLGATEPGLANIISRLSVNNHSSVDYLNYYGPPEEYFPGRYPPGPFSTTYGSANLYQLVHDSNVAYGATISFSKTVVTMTPLQNQIKAVAALADGTFVREAAGGA